MSTITDALSAANSAGATTTNSSSTAAASAADIEDRFLKLLVTQMQNQDPLNPMDNSQITTQLAQISTVSGIDKLNNTMNALSSSFIAGQSVQAASMIGHNVLVNGSNLTLANGAAAGAINVASAADKVVVTISGAAGNIVRQMDLGARSAGLVGFGWDGRTDAGDAAPDGNYTVSVQAMSGAKQVTANPLSIGQVMGVSLGGSGLSVTVNGVGEVKLTDVQRIM